MDRLLEVGAALKSRRLELGLTEEQFAEKFHLDDVELYSEWERGENLPPTYQAFCLLEMLGPENRESFGISLGPLLDDIRGSFGGHRNRAHEAVDIIVERAPDSERADWISIFERAAARYSCPEWRDSERKSPRNVVTENETSKNKHQKAKTSEADRIVSNLKDNKVLLKLERVAECIREQAAVLYRLNSRLGYHHDRMERGTIECDYEWKIEESRQHLDLAVRLLYEHSDGAFNTLCRWSERNWEAKKHMAEFQKKGGAR